jgi:hypothetical protein
MLASLHRSVAPKYLSWWGKVNMSLIVQQNPGFGIVMLCEEKWVGVQIMSTDTSWTSSLSTGMLSTNCLSCTILEDSWQKVNVSDHHKGLNAHESNTLILVKVSSGNKQHVYSVHEFRSLSDREVKKLRLVSSYFGILITSHLQM